MRRRNRNRVICGVLALAGAVTYFVVATPDIRLVGLIPLIVGTYLLLSAAIPAIRWPRDP